MNRPPTTRPPPVARVLRQVIETARRHEMFRPRDRVVVAVSGGPDSLCLLHALVRIRQLLRIEVICFHFDHGLRATSPRDAAYVRRQAARLGIPFVLRGARDRPARGESPEAWARTVRYDALTATLEELGGGVAAVGHTADDRAETVLLALLRGGGLAAVAGMRAVNRPVVRPLIDTPRADTIRFCRSLGLRPRTDPMNQDPAYMRSALRSAIPALEAELGRGIRAALARSAGLLEEDADLLDRLALEAGRAVVTRTRRDEDAARRKPSEEPAVRAEELAMRADELASLPRPIGGRVIRGVLLELGVVPEAAHVDAVLDLAARRSGRAISLPGALKARRAGEYVRVSRSSPAGEAPASRAARSRTGPRRRADGVRG